jgi:threonine dehydratase
VREPFTRWWHAVETLSRPEVDGVNIDAVRDSQALAGNATVAVEILEQMTEVDAILVPVGGGGLACGVASVVRALKPEAKVVACEHVGAQPFSAALRAGKVVSTACHRGFVSGVGFSPMLPEMFPLTRALIDALSACHSRKFPRRSPAGIRISPCAQSCRAATSTMTC